MKDWLGYLREPIPQTIANVPVQLKSAPGVDDTNLRDLFLEILAIVPKSQAAEWLLREGKTTEITEE